MPEDFHIFEAATNRHFNREMNKEQRLDGFVGKEVAMTRNFANSIVDQIKASLSGRPNHNQTTGGGDKRYDRMSRKDFSRKQNSYAPVLMNDTYSNFRFSKRANDLLSPLSKGKFGFS